MHNKINPNSTELYELLLNERALPEDFRGQFVTGSEGTEYCIERRLGAGAMAAVFEVMGSGVRRAMKVLVTPDALDADKRGELAKRFYREYDVLRRIQHPGVLGAIDISPQDSAFQFMVTTYVNGPTLEEYLLARQKRHLLSRLERGETDWCANVLAGASLKSFLASERMSRDAFALYCAERRIGFSVEHCLPVHEAMAIIGQTLSILASVHAAGYVHRDIKPSNLMLSDGVIERAPVRVLDFGIAKSLADSSLLSPDTTQESQLTQMGTILGTPYYMAPEQVLGTVTPRTDLYSVGLVMCELLAGLPAGLLARPDPQQVIWFHLDSADIPVPPMLGGDLARFFQMLVAKKPDYRFLSAAVAAHVLGQILKAPEYRDLRAQIKASANGFGTWNAPDFDELSDDEHAAIERFFTGRSADGSEPSRRSTVTYGERIGDPMIADPQGSVGTMEYKDRQLEQALVSTPIPEGLSTTFDSPQGHGAFTSGDFRSAATGSLTRSSIGSGNARQDSGEVDAPSGPYVEITNEPCMHDGLGSVPNASVAAPSKRKRILVVGLVVLLVGVVLAGSMVFYVVRQTSRSRVKPVRRVRPPVRVRFSAVVPLTPRKRRTWEYQDVGWRYASSSKFPVRIALSSANASVSHVLVTSKHEFSVHRYADGVVTAVYSCNFRQSRWKKVQVADVVWSRDRFVVALGVKRRYAIRTFLVPYGGKGKWDVCPHAPHWRRSKPLFKCGLLAPDPPLVSRPGGEVGVRFQFCLGERRPKRSLSVVLDAALQKRRWVRQLESWSRPLGEQVYRYVENQKQLQKLGVAQKLRFSTKLPYLMDSNSACVVVRSGTNGKYDVRLFCKRR